MKKLAAILLIGEVLVILLSWHRLPPELPLFYSQPWGKEQLTTPFGLFIIPGFSLVIFLINFALLFFLAKEEKLIPKILEITTVVFNLLCLLTLVQIIRLVI